MTAKSLRQCIASAGSDTYCVLPFIHAQVETSGELTPCCRYQGKSSATLKDFESWWAGDLSTLRSDLLLGRRHAGCSNCWQDEARGIKSYRQDCLELFSHHGRVTQPLEYPVFWMMGIGSYCNIRCIMCSPFKSTSYLAEYERNQSEFKRINIDFLNYPRGAWADQDLAQLESVAQSAEMIHFSGGEPLMTPDYLRVLRSVHNPASTALLINSNLQELSTEWIQVLGSFRTHVNVSLEGVGSRNDYIRYGSSWQSVSHNIDRLKSAGISVGVTHAFGRTSMAALIPLLQYCLAQDLAITFTPIRTPEYLSIASAPLNERAAFVAGLKAAPELQAVPGYNRVQEFVKLLDSQTFQPELNVQFWKFIDLMDQLHHMNYRAL